MILDIKNVSKYFGGLRALHDINFSVNPGDILSVIGPNGAGKSTLFNLISGTFPPSKGNIFFLNENITGKKPHQVFRKGIGRTFQTRAFFENMSVTSNLITSQICHTHAGLWDSLWPTKRTRMETQKLNENAAKIAEFVGLEHVQDKLAKNLTLEDRSRLSIGAALAANPKLILLDEPMAALNMQEIDKIVELVRTVRSRGITVCMVEHKMSAVMSISDRIVVLNFGQQIAEGSPSEIVRNQEVMKAYLGEEYAAQHQ